MVLAYGEAALDPVAESLSFYENVSPSQELRDASSEAQGLVEAYRVERSMRLDVFRAKQAAEKSINDSNQDLAPEELRLVEKMILDGTHAGFGLPDEKREELTALKKELSAKCQEFNVRIGLA